MKYTEADYLADLERARKRQMSHDWRRQQPGYDEYAQEARQDVLPNSAEAASMSGIPILSEAGDAALALEAARKGKYGEAALNAAFLAVPFAGAGILTTGGRHAKVAPEIAQEMFDKGASREEVWDQTGWWVDAPGGKPVRNIEDPADLRVERWTPALQAKRQEAVDKINARLDREDKVAEIAKKLIEQYPDRAVRMGMAQRIPDLSPEERQGLSKQLFTGFPSPARRNDKYLFATAEGAYRNPDMASERINHPELFAEHPDLAKTNVQFTDSPAFQGEYRSDNDTVSLSQLGIERAMAQSGGSDYANLGLERSLGSVAIHELGHGVQHRTGMPTGGSPATARARLRAALKEGRVSQEMFDKLNELSDFDLYRRLGGEAYSRLAQRLWHAKQSDFDPYGGLGGLGGAALTHPDQLPANAGNASAGDNYVSPYPWENLDVPLDEIFW